MYLARREYSQCELTVKLEAYGFAVSDVKNILEQLGEQGLQCDNRFAQALFRSRINKGYGPRYIAAELQQKGIDRTLIEQVMGQEIDWQAYCFKCWAKRFQGKIVDSRQKLQKQQQFLYNKGFELAHIKDVLSGKLNIEKAYNEQEVG